MDVIVLESDVVRIGVLPRLGAGLTEMSLRIPGGWEPLMRPTPERPTWFNDLACYLLVPWSNRISDASFRYGGRDRVLKADWPDGTAVHGDVKTREWRLLDRSPYSARLGYDSRDSKDTNWPWRYGAEVRYEVRGASVITELALRNDGSQPFPAGLGFHPFWQRRVLGHEARVTLHTSGRYPAEKMIPKIEVLSIAPLIADALNAVFDDASVSEIFGGENQA